MLFTYRLVLQGTKSKDKTTMAFDLGDLVDFPTAENLAGQIRGALLDITDALVSKETITGILSEGNQLPADADTTDEAVISVHLNAPAEAEKLATIRVPAPIDAVFNADGITVNMAEALVIQYVQQVAQGAYISDGEQIDTASGNDGMAAGYWRSRGKVLGK